MTMSINTTDTDTDNLGHQLRLRLLGQIDSTLVFENELRRRIADNADPAVRVALEELEAHGEAHEVALWDALANAQQIR